MARPPLIGGDLGISSLPRVAVMGITTMLPASGQPVPRPHALL